MGEINELRAYFEEQLEQTGAEEWQTRLGILATEGYLQASLYKPMGGELKDAI